MCTETRGNEGNIVDAMLLPLISLILGPVVLVVLIVRGCLRPGALSAGPSRRVGLMPMDLLIAFALMVIGPLVLLMLMPELKSQGVEGQAVGAVDSLAYAKRALLSQASGQLTPVLYLLWRSSFVKDGPRKIGLLPRKPLRDVRWGLLGWLAAVPMVLATIQVTSIIGELCGAHTPELAHDTLKVLVHSKSTVGTVLIVVSAVLVAPVLEEGLFRGVVQSVMVESLGEGRRWSVVLIVSLMFAMMHADFQTMANWQALPGLFVLGMTLGWLYERSGSLWPGIVVHMGFNALNVAMALVMTKGGG